MNDSTVIRLEWWNNGVAVVKMEDRATRNTFSDAFTRGLHSAFREIDDNADARAVVVHGYDSYFSCGGTREQLLLLAGGRIDYRDIMEFDMLLRCKVPVIAAMQGHALGGGFVFGLYADIVILAEECVYNTNFMHFGFTPGMGATFVTPHKLGQPLGWELLFSGNNYRGAELRDRGAQVQVTRRTRVIDSALEQAAALSEKPVISLHQLKRRFVETVDSELEKAIKRELEMQSITFPLEEVRQKIEAIYPTDNRHRVDPP